MFRRFFSIVRAEWSFSFVLEGRYRQLILSSVVYNSLIHTFFSEKPFDRQALSDELSPSRWIPVLVIAPAIAGFVLGLLESNDVVGRSLRHFGFGFPSPTPTAWETLFRELATDSVLIITLKDGAVVYGRWTRGAGLSSASTDPDITDIFIGETGEIDLEGDYRPKAPQRGIYVAASEIRSIEVIRA